MNCLFRDQHIVGFWSPFIGHGTDSCGRIAKLHGIGVVPMAMQVAAPAYSTTSKSQFHKGRSICNR